MSSALDVKRTLAKNTLVFFAVFALLFGGFGVLAFRFTSATIYRASDDLLEEANPSMQVVGALHDSMGALYALQGRGALTSLGTVLADADNPFGPNGYDERLEQLVEDLFMAISPQTVYLYRNSQGAVVEALGPYSSYDGYFSGTPFDASSLGSIYEVNVNGHDYRAVNYVLAGVGHGAAEGMFGAAEETSAPKAAVGPSEEAYLQVLVNVDSEKATLDGLSSTLAAYLAVAVCVSAAASYLLSRRLLRPLVSNWRKQTEFVQNASHELRTPLSIIRMKQELLLRHPQQRVIDRFEDVDASLDETKRLEKLVGELMQLALQDDRRLEAAKEPVDVDGLVANACDLYADVCEMQGKHLVANLRFRGVAQVDPAQMRQLLSILLDNACKYTEPGDTVTVTTEARSGRLALCVADTGCGLSKEERRRAFERFYRADRARSRATGGNGLGLSIAHGIVSAHRGKITLAPNHPRGTRAVVTLPANG
ncbi:MAG TPA: HAMP domain-containing histidine kinase [Candidatus Rubneribacter avistercoris]|nr:HAMP domain-containing histidine kinase [Candidatus Rubneribacter avistercoris]